MIIVSVTTLVTLVVSLARNSLMTDLGLTFTGHLARHYSPYLLKLIKQKRSTL